MNNVKPEDVKVFGHWHRAYSGTWKYISLCQGMKSCADRFQAIALPGDSNPCAVAFWHILDLVQD